MIFDFHQLTLWTIYFGPGTYITHSIDYYSSTPCSDPLTSYQHRRCSFQVMRFPTISPTFFAPRTAHTQRDELATRTNWEWWPQKTSPTTASMLRNQSMVAQWLMWDQLSSTELL